jgi:tetratricopeptide (TPR) repeat protein
MVRSAQNQVFARLQSIGATVLVCLLLPYSVVGRPDLPGRTVQSAASFKARPRDLATREGFEHLYNTDYDSAVQDFETALRAHPNDAFAANHLLEAILLREIDREDILSGQLYLGNDFLHSKRAAIDSQVQTRIEELTNQALSLSEARLRTKPDDADALYSRGVTRALSALYEGLVEKAWYSALRSALGAYRDHKRVLELAPDYSDAKLVVGVYGYVVAALPIYERIAAFLLAIRGSKTEGIENIRQAANAGGEASVDAKSALSLFLAREHRYPEALSQMRELYQSYPHNFEFGQLEASLLRACGDAPQAVAAYRNLLALGQRNMFPHPHLNRTASSLGQTYRAQGDYRAAAEAFESAAEMPGANREEAARTKLLAGEMYDLLQERDSAIRKYQEVLITSKDSMEEQQARRFLKHPYREP